MRRLKINESLITAWIIGLFLILPLPAASAKNSVDAQPVGELSDLEPVKEVLNVTSPISLVINAWKALEEDDLDLVLALTNDCVDRFGATARQMQEGLKDYAGGSEEEIRSYWALNDVATALFIQGRALQNAGRYREAKKAYKKLIMKYTYGQCWDPKGWFWKLAQEAEENLLMIENGVFWDFGDYTSSALVRKAWEALEAEDVSLALGYVDKCIKLYGELAREMQLQLKDYPKGSNEEISSYWALNDVAIAHFIKAKAYMIDGRDSEVIAEFKTIRDEFLFGQCWDPHGWWWKPADAAGNWLKVLD
jgi:tetratricopeptide (TPR) repeat protein